MTESYKKKMIKNLIRILLLLIVLVITYNFKEIIILKFNYLSNWLYPTNEDRKGELFKTVLSVLGALAILYGIYVSLRRAKAMEAGIEIQSQQIELSRKAQTDERFKNAIEHFGNNNEHIILGGIAELNQIAKENSDEYAEIVFNIFCSFIRSNANIYKKSADEINHTAIQTIIDNLFKDYEKNPYNGLRADLSHTNLYGINLDNLALKGINLSFCFLPSLNNVNLENACLNKSEFSGATIQNVNLKGAEIFKTYFQLSNLIDVDLSNLKNPMNFIFIDSNLEKINFNNNSLYNCFFISSDISSSTFENSEFISNYFIGSGIKDCNLCYFHSFSKNDFRSTGFENVKIESIVTSSNFNGCRNGYSFTQFKKEIENQIGKSPDLTGITFNNELAYQCSFESITKNDIVEMIEIYNKCKESDKLPTPKSLKENTSRKQPL